MMAKKTRRWRKAQNAWWQRIQLMVHAIDDGCCGRPNSQQTVLGRRMYRLGKRWLGLCDEIVADVDGALRPSSECRRQRSTLRRLMVGIHPGLHLDGNPVLVRRAYFRGWTHTERFGPTDGEGPLDLQALGRLNECIAWRMGMWDAEDAGKVRR
jgi:hypothetical protein